MSAAAPAAGLRWAYLLSTLASVGAVLVPKCPGCLFAYGAAISALGLDAAASVVALRIVLFVVSAASVVTVTVLCWERRDAWPAVLAVAGAAVLAVGVESGQGRTLGLTGGAVIVAAAWLNARRCAAGGGDRETARAAEL